MSSWSSRLAALDSASVRLASKTAALNALLLDLQQATLQQRGAPQTKEASDNAVAAASSSRAAAASSTKLSYPSPFAGHAAAAASSGVHSHQLAQVRALQTWLTRMAFTLEHGEAASASAASAPSASSGQASSAAANLQALATMHSAMLASSRPPQQAAPIAVITNLGKSPAKSTPLAQVQALNVAGVPAPPGCAFVNGRWQKQRSSSVASISAGSGPSGGPASPRSALAGGDVDESDEEADPFADFSDDDELPGSRAKSPPRSPMPSRSSLRLNPSPPVGGAHNKKSSSLGAVAFSLRSRAEQPDDDDGADNIDENQLALAASRRAGGKGVADDEEEEDAFAGIEDLPVDEAQEARLRQNEIAKAARKAAVFPGPSKRKAANVAKHATLRKDLQKHMGQDGSDTDGLEVDEDELAQKVRSPPPPQLKNFKPPQAVASSSISIAIAPVVGHKPSASLSKKKDAVPEEEEEDWDVEVADGPEPAAPLPSPVETSSRFTPALPKSAPGVIALTSRREGQKVERDDWSELEVSPSHLRHMSASAKENRPDDLDGLSDDEPAEDADDDDDGDVSDNPSSPVSRQSVSANSAYNHGQLIGALSDNDELDGLDEMLDDDEEEHSKVAVVSNTPSATDRASKNLNEFDLSSLQGQLRDSESHRQSFLSGVDLSRVSALHRAVDEQWLLSLSRQCVQAHPALAQKGLPHLSAADFAPSADTPAAVDAAASNGKRKDNKNRSSRG